MCNQINAKIGLELFDNIILQVLSSAIFDFANMQLIHLGDRESPEEKRAQAHLESWPGFSAFLYWREPVVELPGDILGDLLQSHEDGGSESEEVIEATKVETNNGVDQEMGSDQITVIQSQLTEAGKVIPNLEKDTEEADAALEGQLESLGISCEDNKEGGDQSEDETSSTEESHPTEEKEKAKTEEKESEGKEMKEVVPGCVRGRWQEISTEGDSSWDSTSSQVSGYLLSIMLKLIFSRFIFAEINSLSLSFLFPRAVLIHYSTRRIFKVRWTLACRKALPRQSSASCRSC